jgi:hypothetical protein
VLVDNEESEAIAGKISGKKMTFTEDGNTIIFTKQ